MNLNLKWNCQVFAGDSRAIWKRNNTKRINHIVNRRQTEKILKSRIPSTYMQFHNLHRRLTQVLKDFMNPVHGSGYISVTFLVVS